MTEAYELGTAAPARRALAERPPADVAAAAVELITGPLLRSPQRIGKTLGGDLVGIRSARLERDWRVLYQIDEDKHTVIVLGIQHRASAYRRR